MVEFLANNAESLFQEAVAAGREQGVTDQEGYNSLIDSIIEDHRRLGEIHDDTETETIVEMLRGRWDDYQEQLGLEAANPQI